MLTSTSITKAKNDEENEGTSSLVDLVFSWSIPNVLNKNLFLGKVKPIPRAFSTTSEYFKSFMYPLMEETHADLYSNMAAVSRAPFIKIKIPKNLNDSPSKKHLNDSMKSSETDEDKTCEKGTYKHNLNSFMTFKKVDEKKRWEGTYKPQAGDLIALTSKQPKCIDDLNTSTRQYTLVFIKPKDEDSDEFPVVSSKSIELKDETDILYAIYLINLTTNIRIWKALHPDPEVANLKIIKNILHSDLKAGQACAICSSDGSKEDNARSARDRLQDFGLDVSQETAVTDFVTRKDCPHQNTVKLIWGPPGTGKTKTVASLLKVLLNMKCRTLACAPTNVAVLNVASRLMDLVRPTLEYDTYGLGDILLFGNLERMKIDDNEDLYNVFLDDRVYALYECLTPFSGWKGTVQSMKQLLEDPEERYQSYLRELKEGSNVVDESKEDDERGKKAREDKEAMKVKKARKMKKAKWKIVNKEYEERKMKNKGKVSEADSFWGFYWKKFSKVGNMLLLLMTDLVTHLPTSLVQEELAKEMTRACELFQNLGGLIESNSKTDEALHTVASEKISRACCLQILNYLDQSIHLKDWIGDNSVVVSKKSLMKFCLGNASLIFCTASSAAKLNVESSKPVDLLVIDEAAQLKECESTISLQLPGLRHALLIGDEKQLPAMVQSKICERAEFGRSLFERLVMLGYEKHLLNVQYRMHPSISLFPSREFYQNKIKDGPNVEKESYKKQFLEGIMYGPCSFIDINSGKEHLDEGHSMKNAVEASVVADIVARLHKKSVASKQKFRVGCMSPYKDQVYAIQEKIGKYNTDADSNFSVNVRSVDGFQGGEEDVIIISTVRCNGNGTVGFLSNHQRTNVALTRARHCLWILGNSATLINSGSIWKKLVLDLKARGCYFSANEDKTLVQAISCALIELKQFDQLFNVDSLLFKSASDEFSRSLARVEDSDIQKEVLSVILKLLDGWRPPNEEKFRSSDMNGTLSLLEICDIRMALKLIWNTDIERENSMDVQVIRIQDIIPALAIKKLVARLNAVFENYTMKKIDRCRCKKMEGKLVVPIMWPNESKTDKGDATIDEDFGEKLASRLAAISLKDEKRLTFE